VTHVDTKRFKLPDWLIVGGGAVVFLFGFFDWFDTGSISSSAFKFTLTGVFPWLLIVGTALLTFQIRTGILTVRKWPWPTIFLFATGIAVILLLVRVIIGAEADDFISGAGGANVGRKFTLWLSFFGALAAAAGSFLSFIASGGTVNDLPLVGRIRAARQSAGPKTTPPAGARAAGDAGARRLPAAEQDRPFDADDDTGF
jgi:hypothetical protein